MGKLVVLRNVLLNATDLNWDDSLFLSSNDDKWSLISECYLYNLDHLDDDDEIPKFARDNDFKYVLSIADVQDIVSNAQQQLIKCSELDLFNAFYYYFKNDAFISFISLPPVR
ncbi:DUF7716 domain-containing protein [Priestia koreensis]|uniref:DUF7716 domain-containing protein n=1 Tax=Priestia koreensis TaxID=284581 RepID=UPI001F5ABC47|nr:hypothetical protein [Priestia koreensis]UNL87566.1 hypothetical protein IE339_23985 [Priestia koreensis]